jgi:hypothetical protein
MFKTNSLSNTDITYILKAQGVKLNGVFMKDELPSKLKSGFYVVNLQSSQVGDGTHWTAFITIQRIHFILMLLDFQHQSK